MPFMHIYQLQAPGSRLSWHSRGSGGKTACGLQISSDTPELKVGGGKEHGCDPDPAPETMCPTCFSWAAKDAPQPAVAPDTAREFQCRSCKRQFVPSVTCDFYEDNVDGPGTGLCEPCLMRSVFDAAPKPLPRPGFEKEVCRIGQGAATCCFATMSLDGSGQFQCAKWSGLNNEIVGRQKKGTMLSIGLNCDGPPSFKPFDPPRKWSTQRDGFYGPRGECTSLDAVKKTVNDLREEGFNATLEESYSGRGMFGESCVGIDADNCEADDITAAAQKNGLTGARRDTRGRRGVIVYWPSIKIAPAEEVAGE